MPAPIINLLATADYAATIARAAQMLAAGKLVIMPTDTLYGVAGRIDLPVAVAGLKKLRGGDEATPPPFICPIGKMRCNTSIRPMSWRSACLINSGPGRWR